jgi:hypothetical protein
MMTDSTPSTAPSPGWYADSPSSTRLRWWNGSAWTDHYQAATEALPLAEPSADEIRPPPMTRAERRAAENAARPVDPPITAPPPTRAELRARNEATAVVEEPENDVPVWATPELEVAAGPQSPALVSDAFPDQILDRSMRTKEDRPLPPVVYLPQPSGYVRVPQSTFVPVSSANGPAKASLALILISLLGGVAVYFFVALLFSALGLAVVGLVIAVRRPIKKQESVIALVVSVLLIAGVIALFALRMISLGAVYAGG